MLQELGERCSGARKLRAAPAARQAPPGDWLGGFLSVPSVARSFLARQDLPQILESPGRTHLVGEERNKGQARAVAVVPVSLASRPSPVLGWHRVYKCPAL